MKWILLALLMACRVATGAPLTPGDPLPVLALKDQHDKPLALAPDTRLIFFAAEMEASRLMTKTLEALPPATLQEKKAIYIADISSMPGLVSTMIAVPKMQKAGYRIALLRFEKEGERLPRKPGAVTVLKIDAGKVSAVEFARDAQQIGGHLK